MLVDFYKNVPTPLRLILFCLSNLSINYASLSLSKRVSIVLVLLFVDGPFTKVG